MLHFAWMWMLFLLPLPWLIHRFAPPAQLQPQIGIKIPFFKSINKLIENYQSKNFFVISNFKRYVAYLIWILLVLSAARPEWLGEKIELPRMGRNILLALDVSGSMQILDMALDGTMVSRLDAVKQVATTFIHKREHDRIGLILFGTRAYLETPLTFDHQTVLNLLNDASIGLAGRQTALGDAIGLGLKKLIDLPGKKVMVLLTDGANNAGVIDPLDVAKLAAKYDIKIYTIGIGGGTVPISDLLGQQVASVNSDLDEETLKKIANISGGLFFRAKDTASLVDVYEQINGLEPAIVDKSAYRSITELYVWPLALALCLSLMLTYARVARTFKYEVKTG